MDGSSLTTAQIESLVTYMRYKSGKSTLREAASARKPHPVTVGSYYRTVNQGRGKVKSSLATTIIAIQLGLVRLEDLKRLFDLIATNAQSQDLQEGEKDRVRMIVQVLLNRIVT